MDAYRKQLIYRANHRGIKEMDIVLGGFAARFVEGLSDDDAAAFEQLCSHTDRDLLTWFTGEQPVPQEVATPMFDRVLEFQKSRFGN